jgi:hypothetical protein
MIGAVAVDGFVSLGDLEECEISWWWPGRLAWGMVAVIAGDGGVGKSTLAQELGARMTRGQTAPGGAGPAAPPRGVIILSAEEHTAAVVRPRMRLMGADLDRAFVLDAREEGAELTLPSGIGRVERLCREKEAGLVVIDTGPAFMDPGLKSNAEEDIRRVLAPLAGLAERRDLIVLVLAHLNKAMGAGAGHRIMGGAAWRNAPRSVLLVGAHPGHDPRATGDRVVAVEKSNLGVYPPAQAFRLAPSAGEPERAVVAWQGEIVGVSADDLVSPPPDADERSALEDCAERIEEMLSSGPRQAREAEAELRKQYSSATIRRARQRAGVTREAGTIYQETFRGPHLWRLPESNGARSTDAQWAMSICGDEHLWTSAENPHGDRGFGPSNEDLIFTDAQPRMAEHLCAAVAVPDARSSRMCVRCEEPWPGPGTLCEACLEGAP